MSALFTQTLSSSSDMSLHLSSDAGLRPAALLGFQLETADSGTFQNQNHVGQLFIIRICSFISSPIIEKSLSPSRSVYNIYTRMWMDGWLDVYIYLSAVGSVSLENPQQSLVLRIVPEEQPVKDEFSVLVLGFLELVL